MNSIIWFVTFKYWETARQFSRMVRVLNGEPENNGAPGFPAISRDSASLTNTATNVADDTTEVRLHRRLYKKHKKYSHYKWIGFACVIVLQTAQAVLITLFRSERIKNLEEGVEDNHHGY